jgi:hypothetical protein
MLSRPGLVEDGSRRLLGAAKACRRAIRLRGCAFDEPRSEEEFATQH